MNAPKLITAPVSLILRSCFGAMLLFLCGSSVAQTFSCPAGQIDVMKYFVMAQQTRANLYMGGTPNSIYTEVYPNQDFAPSGYWFWLKSHTAHGFDVKSFDTNYVYMRSTELNWLDNTTFKRFQHDLPIAARCVTAGQPGPQVKVPDTTFTFYAWCGPNKSRNLGTSVNDLDGPVFMNAGGNVGQVWTRVLHYHYDCDKNFGNCKDEEQFYLGNGYGLWKWKHFKNGKLKKSATMNQLQTGGANQMLPCPESYK
ncbi:MAG: hypothetical protein M3O09_02565 [Acidobacteriota bacterium]|nr:hypothetical protein [Acidobacteriota bacterium]